MENYVRGKVLGKGSFGSAVLVTSKKDGKDYVIKEVDISRMPMAEREAAKQEAQLLMALNHPNIVKCLECFTHQNKLCIVMELCAEGDLYGILQKRKSEQLPEDSILDWFVQICLGLKHVHDRKILHRDIKSQNIFVSSGGMLRLGDFGVSKVLASTMQLAATAVGTPYYLSPEICQNKKYNQKSDIWSLGCVLYEMTTLKQAFEAPNMRALIQKVIKGSYTPLPSTRSKELRELVSRMFTLDWQKRPSINDILNMPVVKARIESFLGATLRADEFSHTIIHGRPKPGQLVVKAAPESASRPPSSAGEAVRKSAPAVVPAPAPSSRPPSRPAPAAAPAPSARPSSRQPAPSGRAPSPNPAAAPSARAPSPSPVPSSHPHSAPRPSPGVPSRPGAAAAPAPRPGSGAGAADKRPEAGAGAGAAPGSRVRSSSVDGIKERSSPQSAAAAAAQQKEEEIRKKLERDMSALGVQRDLERLRLMEAQRKRHEQQGGAAAGAAPAPQRNGAAAAAGGGSAGDRLQRKRTALEEERAAREAELAEFQRRNFKEVREAAQRNRQRVMGEIRGILGAPGQGAAPSSGQGAAAAANHGGHGHGHADAGEREHHQFAAMVKDMADLVSGAGGHKEEDDDDDEQEQPGLHAGKVLVNGEMVQLPVRAGDSLGVKVEALRMFLEKRLGCDKFLKVYRKLESLTVQNAAGAAAVEKELLSMLGPEGLQYVPLVRQLIVCEEQWAQEGNK